MGIRDDQLVFDYLSRVGDLAQQRQLPSATRMRLVSELRNEIDRRRAKARHWSGRPAAVRRILSRLGTPDDIVAAAREEGASEAGTDTWAAVPTERAGEADDRPKGLRRVVPRPRPAEPKPAPRPTEADSTLPAPPREHARTGRQLRGSGLVAQGHQPVRAGGQRAGFRRRCGDPQLLKPPPRHEDDDEDESDSVEEAGPKPSRPSKSAKVRKSPKAESPAWSKSPTSPSRPVAASPAPAAGATPSFCWPPSSSSSAPSSATGSPSASAGSSPGPPPAEPVESKWAVLGMPGLAVTAGVVWLWGRTDGRWAIRSSRGT